MEFMKCGSASAMCRRSPRQFSDCNSGNRQFDRSVESLSAASARSSCAGGSESGTGIGRPGPSPPPFPPSPGGGGGRTGGGAAGRSATGRPCMGCPSSPGRIGNGGGVPTSPDGCEARCSGCLVFCAEFCGRCGGRCGCVALLSVEGACFCAGSGGRSGGRGGCTGLRSGAGACFCAGEVSEVGAGAVSCLGAVDLLEGAFCAPFSFASCSNFFRSLGGNRFGFSRSAGLASCASLVFAVSELVSGLGAAGRLTGSADGRACPGLAAAGFGLAG